MKLNLLFFCLIFLFAFFLISCGKESATTTSSSSTSVNLRTQADATVPKAGGVATSSDSSENLIMSNDNIVTKGATALPDWFKLGGTTQTNTGWMGFEIFRFFAKSSRFDFSSVSSSSTGDWGVENLFDNMDVASSIGAAVTTPLTATTKTITVNNQSIDLTLAAADASGSINMPFLNGSGFTAQTYQYQRTVTFSDMTVQIAWSHESSVWKMIIKMGSSNENTHMVSSYNESTGDLYIERASRSSSSTHHVRIRIDGNTSTKNFTVKYLKRSHNATSGSYSAIAMDLTGNANDSSTTAHYIGRIRYLTGSDATITGATVAYLCSNAKSLDTDYNSWYDTARAAAASSDYASNLNEHSAFTSIAGLQYIIHSAPLDLATDFGTNTICTASDVTAINAVTGFENTDLPIEGHSAEGSANWTGTLF